MSESGLENSSKHQRLKKYLGFFCLFLSIFFMVSFISYLFTWQEDQDKVDRSFFSYLFDEKYTSSNVFGKIGAFFAHVFIYQGIGLSALFIPPILFFIGIYALTSRWIIPIKTWLIQSIFWGLWLSLVLGFFSGGTWTWIGGVFGYQSSHLLANWLGGLGFLSLALFSVLVFGSFQYAWDIGKWFAAKKQPNDIKADSPPLTPDTQATISDDLPEETNLKTRSTKALNTDYNPAQRHTKFGAIELKPKDNQEDLLAEESPLSEEFFGAEHIPPPSLESIELEVPATVNSSLADLELEVSTPEEPVDLPVTEEEPRLGSLQEAYDPTLDLGSFQMPTIELLNDFGDAEININREELEANKNRIVSTLGNYNIEIAKIKATVGPTVTLYEIVPAPGVRISKIKNLEDDIALSLSALGIRIIAPIPGKGTIGIEVPNQNPEMVGMRSILQSDKFQHAKMDLPLALGKTISNEVYITDLAKMPHLLMAGATGQGKSVGLNAILVSLLYKKHPSQIKFVLVDPKKVELTLFNKIERHYLAKLPGTEEAIITDTKKVVHTLNSLCVEMDHRYELLKDAQVRNLKEYNTKFVERKLNPEHGHKFLPYIVLVIDEFADLIMTAGKEVETPIARLAQLARAIGIHLIIATQRPSVNIITGTIKANFPSRIAFRVTSKVDSRTILDSGGAEQLIGKGDMLVSLGSDLTRIQCAFVDTPEVEKICEFIGGQRGYPEAFMLPEFIDENADQEKEDFSLEDRDAMFEEAARILVTHQQGSASLLQRKLKLGYNRAGRIVDQLEAAGVLGPFEGSKPRQVLFKDLSSLEQFLQSLQ